ncbi:MAG: hypothetical protein OEM24_15030 [Paracoccaceae bacterium]|nr:hypothetical protein [Paracoccaceae bacterium]
MTDTIIKLLAFALLVAFLGILFAWVPRVDLAFVLGITVILAGIDFFWKKS